MEKLSACYSIHKCEIMFQQLSKKVTDALL